MARNNNKQFVDVKIVNGQPLLYFNLNSIDKELTVLNQVIVKEGDNLIFTLYDGTTLIGKGDAAVPPVTSGRADRFIPIHAAEFDTLSFGNFNGQVRVERPPTSGGVRPSSIDLPSFNLNISLAQVEAQPVVLKPAFVEPSADKSFWQEIIDSSIDFKSYKRFLDAVLCDPVSTTDLTIVEKDREMFKNRLPFLNVDEYSLIKFATDRYMQKTLRISGATGYFGGSTRLPYFESLSDGLDDILNEYINKGKDCIQRGDERLKEVPLLELIWSYWMEQALLNQTMAVINLRFQNIRGPKEVESLVRFDTSPLRSLSSLLWGHIMDEQHRTTLHRRVFEYQHAYNLTLIGKAVPRGVGVDNRSNFLFAFHNLLHQASIFYRDHDDMTRRADSFPLLTALREVHLLLAEGNHNAYFNMTWNSRAEMLVQQYILARAEMKTFLGGRPMVPYPQEWMDRVDTMKGIQGWDSTSVLHYYDLADAGEKILLSIRYGDLANTGFNAANATNWAISFQDFNKRYINAYRTVTGIDLSADAFRTSPQQWGLQPAVLIQKRLAMSGKPLPIPQQKVLVRRY